MRVSLICISKTTEAYLAQGIDIYEQRLKHYLKYQRTEIPDLKNSKNLSKDQQKQKEAELILAKIHPTDHVILLDEKGKSFSSVQFSKEINKWMNQSVQSIVFVIGGPYGFDDQLYSRANGKISLSEMTFSHQMVRLFFTEQIYRAMTILKGEPYHHE